MIIGFVVNVYNPLNFDIDLGTMDDVYIRQLLNRHKFITSTDYQYTDDDSSHPVHTGMTFRCRLAGILKKKPGSYPSIDYIYSLRKLIYHIHKLNGWVYVRIIGVDRYQRLLVELYDVITGVSIMDELLTYPSVYITYHSLK